MAKTSGIYALVLDNRVFYVGQSKNIEQRYKSHCRISNNKSNNKRCNWLSSLISKKVFPELQILEVTNDLDNREIYWISYYRNLNQAIYNSADGGTSIQYANKVKAQSVYAGKWTPLQRFTQMIRQNQKIHKKIGKEEYVNKCNQMIDLLYFLEKHFGKDYLNQKLAKKYG